MEKTVELANKTYVVIREMRSDDQDRSFAFFRALPPEDRRYLRADVTQRALVERRVRDVEAGTVIRLVAQDDDQIVADATLELRGHGWGDNVGELRLIVARRFQRLGLARCLARELLLHAADRDLDRIVVRMMRPQAGARKIMRDVGFEEEFVIPNHVRDQDGNWQDLIIMRAELAHLLVRIREEIALETQ